MYFSLNSRERGKRHRRPPEGSKPPKGFGVSLTPRHEEGLIPAGICVMNKKATEDKTLNKEKISCCIKLLEESKQILRKTI